ncbi:sigma-54 interaction domain-containing protein [Clostridium sp. UBA4548]|uniref:sigma-54 interaction domain-containing protein n=1 Tax=Clostridium sp. UBA4548 TaxID=1946361 RepID=UPI0025BF4502|nr:sigma 54-interacting transcriptional regulator [Clostridium sp. UBA4548]
MYTFEDIVGESENIRRVKELGEKASNTGSSVLIYGDTGTGKELIVQAIHEASVRRNRNFIPQNCAAIPENLLESIFFGTSKGSFTGAESQVGLFELAHRGTLYLDELNSMPINFQGKLLRVLQDGEVRRVGDAASKKVDVRIIASLNENPEDLVEQGRLRKDLYYRLNVIRINLPNLNDRKEDIPLLVKCFVEKFNERFNKAITGISTEALQGLVKHDYEGNIRELEHIIEGAFNIRSQGVIELKDLYLREKVKAFADWSLKDKLEYYEKKYIKEAVILADYNISKAAKFLDIPRQTLQYKMKKYNI